MLSRSKKVFYVFNLFSRSLFFHLQVLIYRMEYLPGEFMLRNIHAESCFLSYIAYHRGVDENNKPYFPYDFS